MYKVTLPQVNKVLICPPGKNLMDLLIENGLPVASSCLGDGICSKCVVDCDPQGSLTELEIKTLTKNKRPLDQRLSCQLFVDQDLTVTTSYW